MSQVSEQQIDAEERDILNVWHEWEMREDERRVILCVETSVEMRPGYAGFDPAQLETVMENATKLMRASASPIDALRIVPARWTL